MERKPQLNSEHLDWTTYRDRCGQCGCEIVSYQNNRRQPRTRYILCHTCTMRAVEADRAREKLL